MRNFATRFMSALAIASVLFVAGPGITPAKAQSSRDIAMIMGVVGAVATIAATAHARQNGYGRPAYASSGYRPQPMRCPPGFQPVPMGYSQTGYAPNSYGPSGYGPTGYGPTVYGAGPSRFDHDIGHRQGYGGHPPRHHRQGRCVEIPGMRTGSAVGARGQIGQSCWTEVRQVRSPSGVTTRRVRVCDEN